MATPFVLNEQKERPMATPFVEKSALALWY